MDANTIEGEYPEDLSKNIFCIEFKKKKKKKKEITSPEDYY